MSEKWMDISEEKIAQEWKPCPQCKYNSLGTSKCMGCTIFYGYVPDVVMCGIPCGTTTVYYHKNFEKIEE